MKKLLACLLTLSLLLTCASFSLAESKTYTIGVSQFAVHGSLDNCREGFLQGLKEEGIEEGKNLKMTFDSPAFAWKRLHNQEFRPRIYV